MLLHLARLISRYDVDHQNFREYALIDGTQGKAKYKSWKKLSEEGITVDEAKERYVKKIEEMKETYGYDANKQPEAVGSS
jgi:acyl-CoA-binding protein